MTDSDEVEPGEIVKSEQLSQQALSELWRLRAAGVSGLEDPRDLIDRQTMHEIDIQATVKEFRVCLEKLGISQRFAARYIMDQSSQGNLSFLLDKGRHKLWGEMSPRGRLPYVRMRQWLDSLQQQKDTLDLLERTKASKRSGPRDAWGKREKFSLFQVTVLCRMFEEDPNPSLGARTILAEKLQIPLEKVTVWFQNQRARGFPARKILTQSNPSKNYYDPSKDHRFIQSLQQKFMDVNNSPETQESSPQDLSMKSKSVSNSQQQPLPYVHPSTTQEPVGAYNQLMMCNAMNGYENIQRTMLERFLNTQYFSVKRRADMQMNGLLKRPRTSSFSESEIDDQEMANFNELSENGSRMNEYSEHLHHNTEDNCDKKINETTRENIDQQIALTTNRGDMLAIENSVARLSNGLDYHLKKEDSEGHT
ncbi:hypothetical protein ScPMuIL_015689 [Solemya velum]